MNCNETISLQNENFLNRDEVDAVAATMATYSLYSRGKLDRMSYGKINLRAAHISVVFIRTYGFVLTLLAACGYPVPMSAVKMHISSLNETPIVMILRANDEYIVSEHRVHEI